jgi:PPOX class probable F420-dependent enzyme
MPDRKLESRLKKELVVWLVTAGKNLRPQAVPVWFLWDGDSFLIYSVDGVKVRHIKANPNVVLHLNSDEVGDSVVRVSGKAAVSKSQPPAHKVSAYMRKYGGQIKGLGLTGEDFSKQYHNAIRVGQLRFH